MRILLVEDEPDLRVLAAEGLRRRGFVVDAVALLGDARECLAVSRFDAAIVDRRLPDGEGLNLLPALVAADVPALIATAYGDKEDRVAGLDAGADDYLVKPYDLDEVAARLRALLRRPGRRRAPVLAFAGLHFDPATQEATLGGVNLPLGRREAAFLHLLLAAAPATVVRDQIEDRLYALDEATTPNAVEALVSRLRKRLTASGIAIETRRGIGWRLIEDRPA